jgi:hypothetical protein
MVGKLRIAIAMVHNLPVPSAAADDGLRLVGRVDLKAHG